MYGQGGFDRPSEGFVPVKVGDELDIKIEAVGEKGDGIAKKDGFVLFVPNTKEGEEVRIRVIKVLRKVGFAEVIGKAEGSVNSVKKTAKERTQPQPRVYEEPPAEDTEDFGEEAEDQASEEPEVPEPPEEEKESTE